MSFAEPELGAVDIPDDLIARVRPELQPGERRMWVGRPIRRPPMFMGNIGWVIGCLGLFYTLDAFFLALFLGVAATWIEPLGVFKVLGTICAVIAGFGTIFWIVGGILSLIDRRRVHREFYALTDPCIDLAAGWNSWFNTDIFTRTRSL